MKLAIFDFDGTIYKNETFKLLMNHLKRTYPTRYKTFFKEILWIYLASKIKLISEKNMKAYLMQKYIETIDDLSTTEMEAYFADVAAQMTTMFNLKVVEQLKAHQKNGFAIIIVSGAFTPLLRHATKSLPIDRIIGTEIPKQGENIDHVYADRKLILIDEEFLSFEINWQESYAYGDSITDRSMLELVGNPIAVCPDKKLQNVARKKNWKIID